LNTLARKARITHLAGPNATIQNTPPLVTSNKARAKNKLPLLTNPDGTPARFDVLRAQRLAAPVTVYVEQFSARPLEADAAELYGPPDGYIDSTGLVHKDRQSPSDKPGCAPRTGSVADHTLRPLGGTAANWQRRVD
jgi:L-asparaginase